MPLFGKEKNFQAGKGIKEKANECKPEKKRMKENRGKAVILN